MIVPLVSSDLIFTSVITLVVGVLSATAFWKYWSERKKTGAEGKVAEATIELNVDMTRMQNLEERFGLTQKAWDEERASFERRLTAAENALAEEKKECGENIEKLERHVRELTTAVVKLSGAAEGKAK